MTEREQPGRLGAGDALQDLCRVCKAVRAHTVIVVDGEGRPLRVICDYCGSQHNYRGPDREEPPRAQPSPPAAALDPLVAERERRFPVANMSTDDGAPVDLELLLRTIIREEIGLTPVPIAEKWRGGDLILRPGKAGLQEKTWPIDVFFHKVVMLRNRLRVLEQQVNAMDVPEDQKIKLQGYISGCYGTLTSFNVLFAEEKERFHGSASDE